MNKTLLGVFAVAMCFALGHTLQCYKCDIGFFGLCVTTTVTCQSGELCYSGEGKAVGVVNVQMRGCLPVGQCNQTTDVNFPANTNTTVYKMTKTCCSGDLCNAAVPLASTHTLTLAIASLASFFLNKMLV